MNQGMSLVALAQELERQKTAVKDFIAPQGAIEMAVEAGEPVLQAVSTKTSTDGRVSSADRFQVPLKPHAHAQLATHLEIPQRYYDRMRAERPGLLAENVNAWLHRDADANNTKRMVRTLDGQARAFLSSSYRPLDNHELADAVLPILLQTKAQIVSTAITETRMYVKAILPSLSDEIPEGLQLGVGHNFMRKDVVVAGLVVSNSEVGAGAVRVEPMVFKTRCTNLAIIAESKMKRHHVGRDRGLDVDGSSIEELLRDETKHARDVAFWNMVRDVVTSAFDPKVFRSHVERMRQAAEEPIESDDLLRVVEVTSKKLAVPESLNNSILKQLAGGADLSRWGLVNAYTAVANDAAEYETSTMLERAGGEILALPKRDWQLIAQASKAA